MPGHYAAGSCPSGPWVDWFRLRNEKVAQLPGSSPRSRLWTATRRGLFADPGSIRGADYTEADANTDAIVEAFKNLIRVVPDWRASALVRRRSLLVTSMGKDAIDTLQCTP